MAPRPQVGIVTNPPPDPRQVGLGTRVGEAVKAFATSFFGPLTPSLPLPETQEEGPRGFHYQSGYNLPFQPRAAEGLTPFQSLISIAGSYDTVGACIQFRTEEMSSMDWSIVDRDEKSPASQSEKDDLRAFLMKPDGITMFEDWVTAIVEEVLVTDALSIYLPTDRGGKVMGLELIDGSTIRCLSDAHGRTPRAPAPSHQQVILGRPTWEGTTDNFGYFPKTRRTRSLYGQSPTEKLAITINRALRRQLFDLSYYSEGNVPEAILPVPDLPPDQIEVLQAWFDNITSDDTQRRRMHLMPSTTGRLTPFEFKRPTLDAAVEEFLDKRTLAIFGVTAQDLGFESGSKASGALTENVSYRRQLALVKFISRVVSHCAFMAGFTKCRLQFNGEVPEEDKLRQAQVDKIYIGMGKSVIDELRLRDGEDPLGISEPFVMVAGGPVPLKHALEEAMKPPEPPPGGPPVAGGQPPSANPEPPEEPNDGIPSKEGILDPMGDITRYSDDQPRDDDGRFGSGDEGKTTWASGGKAEKAAMKLLSQGQHPGVSLVHLEARGPKIERDGVTADPPNVPPPGGPSSPTAPGTIERSNLRPLDPRPPLRAGNLVNSLGKSIRLPADVTSTLSSVLAFAADNGYTGVTLVGSFANGDSDKRGEGTSDIDVLLHPPTAALDWQPSSDQSAAVKELETTLNERAGQRPVEITVGPYLHQETEGWQAAYVCLQGMTDVVTAQELGVTRYSDDQPRDDHGRFGDEGGSSDGPSFSLGPMSEDELRFAEHQAEEGLNNVFLSTGPGMEATPGLMNDGEIKAAVARDIAGRLEGNPAFERLAVDNFGGGQAARLEMASKLIGGWAVTSGDTDPQAISMQLAARDEFGLHGAAFAHLGEGKYGEPNSTEASREAEKIYARDGDGQRAFLRAMYDNTQARFREAGVTELVVYRGVVGEGPKEAGQHEVHLQPISSYSTSRETAASFGSGGYMLGGRVPVGRIIGSFISGYGCREEKEVVIMGGRPEKQWFVPRWGPNAASAKNSLIAFSRASGHRSPGGIPSVSSAAQKNIDSWGTKL